MSLVEKIQEGFTLISPKIRVLVAERRRRPGEVLTEKIRTLITECHLVIVLWTPNLENSIMANQEIGYADALGKPIVPFILSGMTLKGLLLGIEYIECDSVEVENDIKILIEEIVSLAKNLGYKV